jgi:hypothetical protein
MNKEEIDKICEEIKNLLIEKNKRYGKTNISEFGEQGVTIRINDKVERLKNIVMNKVEETDDERLEDTYKDLAGYAIIGLMVHRGKW